MERPLDNMFDYYKHTSMFWNDMIAMMSSKPSALMAVGPLRNFTENIKKISQEWNKRSNHTVIGITGSNGKTTTKDLLFSILNKNNSCYKSIGNYNSSIGLPISYLSSKKDDKFCIIAGDFNYELNKPDDEMKINLETQLFDNSEIFNFIFKNKKKRKN